MKHLTPNIEASGISVIGPVREDNQDSIMLPDASLPPIAGSLYAVADGMGGYAHGGVASNLALEALFSVLQQKPHAAPGKALRYGIESANLNVYKTAQSMGAGRMGTTITAAYVIGDQLHLAHVGDSRAYLVRGQQVSCLTNDHTVVGDMVRARLLSPDKVRTHAQRSILTRAIGLALFVQPDLAQVRLQAGDRVILCSDGVWSVLEDNDFAQVAHDQSHPERIGQKLIDLALAHETDDNCSVVTLQVRGFTETVLPEGMPPERRNGQGLTGWVKNLLKSS